MSKKLLGVGVVNWDRDERVSDRYGLVKLTVDPSSDDTISLKKVRGKGKLIAKILETRQSPHIGDLAHGIKPGGSKEGEELILGTGTAFYEDGCIGLKPDDGRLEWWLNPKMLYKAHYQTVELYFEPDKK